MGANGNANRKFSVAATALRRAAYTTTKAHGSKPWAKAFTTLARLPSPYVTLKPTSLAACITIPGHTVGMPLRTHVSLLWLQDTMKSGK